MRHWPADIYVYVLADVLMYLLIPLFVLYYRGTSYLGNGPASAVVGRGAGVLKAAAECTAQCTVHFSGC